MSIEAILPEINCDIDESHFYIKKGAADIARREDRPGSLIFMYDPYGQPCAVYDLVGPQNSSTNKALNIKAGRIHI